MKILVIGGGMAGLTYAVVAAKNGYDVTVAERNSRVGKKISMTGNGRCNVGNAAVSLACYNKSPLVGRVLSAVSADEYLRFLKSCGIYTYADSEGRLYPLSDSASSVADCLRYQLAKYGGKTLCDADVTSCKACQDGYEVRIGGVKGVFGKVILACGSGSQAQSPYAIIPNEYLTPLVPSLVPVKIHNMEGVLNGIRVKADVSLYDGALPLAKQSGEVLFKDYGLSGICVFNLSAVIARRQVRKQQGDYYFVVDLVPNTEQWDLADILYLRTKSGWDNDKLFYGILHNKVAECVIKRCGGVKDVSALAHTAKNMRFQYLKSLDFSMSQVTAGGIEDRIVDPDTLTLPNGVVALGEVLNVDGICGGNNLYFAAASALYTFSKAERENAYSKI